MTDLEALDNNRLFQPHKDTMILLRNQILNDFKLPLSALLEESWLDKFIKCECLRDVCDDVSKVLNDMLSVTSSELGSVLRKLRYTYKQAFEQMIISLKKLYSIFVIIKNELNVCQSELIEVKLNLNNKEDDMKVIVNDEIIKVTTGFEKQRLIDKETIAQVHAYYIFIK